MYIKVYIIHPDTIIIRKNMLMMEINNTIKFKASKADGMYILT